MRASKGSSAKLDSDLQGVPYLVYTLIANRYLSVGDAWQVSLYDADCVYRTLIAEQEMVK